MVFYILNIQVRIHLVKYDCSKMVNIKNNMNSCKYIEISRGIKYYHYILNIIMKKSNHFYYC